MKIGKHLARARISAALTQREVEKRTGIKYQSISNWEHDVSYPSIPKLIQLADVYQCSLDELVGVSTVLRRTAAGINMVGRGEAS